MKPPPGKLVGEVMRVDLLGGGNRVIGDETEGRARRVAPYAEAGDLGYFGAQCRCRTHARSRELLIACRAETLHDCPGCSGG